MEINHGRRNSDMFSFPIPDSDQPGSPNSPADHLFLNGKLLPHYFPTTQTPNNFSNYSRSTSRTSSLMSSRSNSSNSCSSSARSSMSEAASERKLIVPSRRERKNINPAAAASSCQYNYNYHHYERWQLFGAPALKQQGRGSRTTRKAVAPAKINNVQRKCPKKSSSWFGWKIFKLFVLACKECHAIKT